ncbi:protein PRR14L isoform X2 [Rhineura floridana]|uniref:protein PRR14L isoform X2 n=1 Tax=Rhineura floridana TaxID=261503 RepID=UPI002AC7F1FA|nr:protein PRR14L isoform X2 [Rhineura floridana]
MSAVVQELYSGLPVTLATERTALLDPAIVFGAKPDAPAFVLSCSSLPSEHYRTHGLKICSKDSAERLDCTGKAPSPGLMDLPSQEPVEAGGLVKDDETLNRDVMKLDLNHGCSKEDAGAAKDLGSVVEEGLAQYSLISKEISKEKAPCLIHEGRKFLPRPSSVEIASLQQNPEENQANVQVTTENLSDPMKEAQGGCRLEASPKGRSLQAAEGCQKLAGDKKKPLKDHLASLGAVEKARGSEAGDRLMLTQKPLREEAEQTLALPVASCDAVGQEEGAEVKATVKRPLKRRLLNLGPPLGSSSREMVVKSGGPAWRAFAGGSAVEDGKYEDPWCTLRRAKRPKRVKDLIELKCPEAESLSLCFRSQGRQSAASNSPVLLVFCTLPQTAGFSYDRSRSPSIRTHKIRPLLPFRRQPGKACFRVRVPGQFRVARSHLMANSAFLRDPNPKCQLMESVCFAMKPTGSKVGMVRAQMPKQRGSPSSLPDSPWLRNHTKEPALLRKLSVLADKLLAPPRSPQNLTQLLVSTELLPVPENYSQLGSKKLLEVFSCVDMKLNSPWLKGGSCSLKMFSSQSLALYPLELTNLFFLELGNKTSLAFSTPVFPVSFHIKMDSSPTSNLLGLTSLHSAPHSHQPVLGEAQALQPSKWAFSFLLSQNCLGVAPIQKDACIPSVSPAVPPASPTAAKGRGREAAAHWRRAGGCPTLAHPTALALSSLGCYRVWTRKRNLGHRIPTLPKLAVRQFTRGLKGLTCSPVVSADLSSSWPSSLGRVLSIWSRHGPPTCPSEITPLRSNLGKWQPVRVATARLGFFGNSSTMLPQVPDQLVDNPRAASDAWRLEPSFSASLPTSCSVLEPARSPLGLPAPSFQVHPLDRLDVPVPVLPEAGSRLEKADLETRPKKVSQIRIRKTVPKPDPNLTPMGLPRPKRLKKTEFSLEEIYTNKNYKSPPTTRCLETIFEEPKEKNGSLISVSQQKRKRILEFQDFTVPRKRKARSRVKATGGSTRAQKAALEGRELDILLIQKLTDLETFFAKEEEQEQASGS